MSDTDIVTQGGIKKETDLSKRFEQARKDKDMPEGMSDQIKARTFQQFSKDVQYEAIFMRAKSQGVNLYRYHATEQRERTLTIKAKMHYKNNRDTLEARAYQKLLTKRMAFGLENTPKGMKHGNLKAQARKMVYNQTSQRLQRIAEISARYKKSALDPRTIHLPKDMIPRTWTRQAFNKSDRGKSEPSKERENKAPQAKQERSQSKSDRGERER